jgi:hypothetical protein
MYKNLFVGLLAEEGDRRYVYSYLNSQNKKVYYTTNARAIPSKGNVRRSKGMNIIVEPAGFQLEYCDKPIYKMNYIKDILVDRQLLIKLDMANDKQLKTLKKYIDNQYSIKDIRNYLRKEVV